MRAQPDDDPVGAVRPLGPEGRQAAIIDLVLRHGSVSAQELAETFAVSVMTIHRDLDELQRQGVLRKSRGCSWTTRRRCCRCSRTWPSWFR